MIPVENNQILDLVCLAPDDDDDSRTDSDSSSDDSGRADAVEEEASRHRGIEAVGMGDGARRVCGPDL